MSSGRNLKLGSNQHLKKALGVPSSQDHKRDLDLTDPNIEKTEKTILFWIKMIGLGVLAFLGLSILVVYTLHLLLPEEHRWLTSSGLETIKDLTTSIVAGLLMSWSIKLYTK